MKFDKNSIWSQAEQAELVLQPRSSSLRAGLELWYLIGTFPHLPCLVGSAFAL